MNRDLTPRRGGGILADQMRLNEWGRGAAGPSERVRMHHRSLHMVLRGLMLAGIGLAVLLRGGRADAAEPVQAFIEGLRDRGYYDTALQYLDQLDQKGTLPPEQRELIPYERAQTLKAGALLLNSAESQRQQLDAARAAYQQFSTASPKHPLAPKANTSQGQILIKKARIEIHESDDPANSNVRKKLQSDARDLLTQARGVFKAAGDAYKAKLDQFPSFIPEGETVRIAERRAAEDLYLEVVLELAQCAYWESHTYERGSQEATDSLQKASSEFEEVFNAHRLQIVGKYGRLWWGKCYEEQDQITQAIGIYDDLLLIEPTTPATTGLHDLSLRFKLICLNHAMKKDYPLVVTLAEEWISDAKGRTRTEVGLGIQWELCRAQESLGRDQAVAESERTQALNQALARARILNRTSGEFKAPAGAMVQRILLALNRSSDDPTDFDSAYGLAGKLQEDLRQLRQQIDDAQKSGDAAEAKSKQQALQTAASELVRVCNLALRLPATDPKMADNTALLLAYGYLLADRPLDAAVVAEFQMKRSGVSNPDSAKQAAIVAIGALDRAYQKAKGQDRAFEARSLRGLALRIEQQQPDSDQANLARETIAKVYRDDGQLDEAALWWNKIPPGSQYYASSQLMVGQAYWGQYGLRAGLPDGERPSNEKLQEWQSLAMKHLETGIAERMKALPADAVTPDDLILAKMTLAQIRNRQGQYIAKDGVPGAIELLTRDPHAVMTAIDMPAGKPRPKAAGNPRGRALASFAYQQLLKAYIGIKDLDSARDARLKLEAVAAGDSSDAEALTQVFIEFGQELENELNQLQAAGDTFRLDEVRTGFESFLNDMFQREDGQNFSSLFWIAETFSSLADGSKDSQSRADGFLAKAAEAYGKILDRSKADATFSTPPNLVAIKVRLVHCRAAQRSFLEAETILQELLHDPAAKEIPNVQMAAAEMYQTWGASGGADAGKNYEIAIGGQKSPVPMWGWAYTAQRIQRANRSRRDPKLESFELESRYNLAVCQQALGRTQLTSAAQKKTLEQAKFGLEAFAGLSNELPPEEFIRFNLLYRELLRDLGEQQVDLAVGMGGKPAIDPGVAAHGAAPVVQAPEAAPETEVTAEPVAEAKPQTKTNYLVIVVLALLGGGVVAWILRTSMKPRNQYTSRYTVRPEALPEPESTAPAPTRPAKTKSTRLPGKPPE